MEYVKFDSLRVTRPLGIITILSSMGVLMDGYALSIFSTAYIYLKHTILSAAILVSLGSSAIYIGMLLGSLVFGNLSDRYGRKTIYTYDLALTAVFLLLTGLSHNFYEFFAFQALAGVGIGADYPISSSIQAEFSPLRSRGRFLVFNIFSWTIGSIIFYAISIPIVLFTGSLAWRVMYFTGAVIPVLVILSRRGIPESPYWLEGAGEEEKAREVVRDFGKYAGVENVKPPEVDRNIGVGSLRNMTLLVLFTSLAWFCYDVSSYGVWNYTPSIFISSSGTYVSSIVGTLLEEIPVIAGTLVCLALIERVGRRRLEYTGFLLAGVSLLAFALTSLRTGIPFLATFFAFALMHLFHNIGPTNITYLYPAELFPTRSRGTGMGLATSASRVGAILGVFAFPLLTSSLNISYGLLFFAVFEFIGFGVTFALAPETRGRPLA